MDPATDTALVSRPSSSETADPLAVGKTSATSRVPRNQARSVRLPVPEEPRAAGSAQPLDPAVRALMERAFSTDFSTVRVHETSQVEEVEAVAYAQGEDLYFAPGTYQPQSEQGRELIGHELAHVVQQRQGRSVVPQGKGAPVDADPALEREADSQGARAARGEIVVTSASAPLAGAAPISRKPTKWTEIELTSDGKAKWVPHKTQPKTTDDRGAFDAEGKGMNVLGAPRADDKWETAISTKPATIGSGGVRALKLGPDHPRGAPVNPAKLPHLAKLDSKADAAAKSVPLGAPPAYVAETVLPSALGGDGQKLHHLVALPPDAAAELRRVHTLLIKLVEQEKGWLSFDSWVTNTKDGDTLYPASVKLRWMELDSVGASVPGTTGDIELKLPTPSDWGKAAGASTVDAADQLGIHDNRAKTALGALHRDDQTATRFQTRIHWEPTFGNGDGQKMVANPLGPDHKIGEEPVAGADRIWNKRTAALRKASGQKTADSYVAGHLLNHHLGGPGNDPRNLAAIPSDANKVHLNEVETPIKRLVNDHKAWVYYSVEVQQSTDAAATGGPVDYPSAFICRWHQLDDHGAEIPDTHGAKTIDIKAPSAYTSDDSDVTDDGTETKAEKLRKGTARSRLGYDELVLEDSDTLKHQRQAMAPLIKVLQEMQLHGDFIHEDVKASVELVVEAVRPRTDEKDALEGIAKISGTLEKLASTASVEELAKLLPTLTNDLLGHTQKAEQEMKHRHSEAQKAAQAHLSKRFLPMKAAKLGEALKASLGYDSEAFYAMVKMVQQLVHFAELAVSRAVEHREGLFRSAATLREWLGAAAPDPSSTAIELEDDVDTSFFQGLTNVRETIFAPMSPATFQDYGESVVGSSVRGGSVSDTQGLVMGYMTQPQQGRGEMPDFSSFTPHNGLARMKKLLALHGDAWPKGVRTGNIATLIELLAPTYKLNPSAADFALSSYYFMAPDEFLEYVVALESL